MVITELALDTPIWDTDGFALVQLRLRAEKLAERLDIMLERWEEDGLGEAWGFGGRLPSGLIVFVRELVHAVENLGAQGPTIYVDAGLVVERGVANMVADILRELALSAEDVGWVQPESAVESARETCRLVELYKQRKMQV